ncbi:unnamed protein product [Rhodiola kirilowii]
MPVPKSRVASHVAPSLAPEKPRVVPATQGLRTKSQVLQGSRSRSRVKVRVARISRLVLRGLTSSAVCFGQVPFR